MQPEVNDLYERARSHLLESAALKQQIAEQCLGDILVAAKLIAETFRLGGKVLLCGNGGSAADCQHIASEFVNLLSKNFPRPGLPALALTTDTSFLTAYGNDFGFEGVYERQVETLGRPGDVLIGISTSGNSPNIIRAVDAAMKMGLRTIGLVGEGGKLVELVDCAIAVPSRDTQYIQESLLSVEHILCHLVERIIFERAVLSGRVNTSEILSNL
jgi:D-sedoheptulose 7-phosphate isomerase